MKGRSPAISVRLLGPAEATLLDNVAADVFDKPVQSKLAQEFLADPRHHLAVALSTDGEVVGMASGVHYVHPDKPARLFINEVGVSAKLEGKGIGKQLMNVLIEHARELGCSKAWVSTEPDNAAAQALYAKVGGTKQPSVMFTFWLQDAAGARMYED